MSDFREETKAFSKLLREEIMRVQQELPKAEENREYVAEEVHGAPWMKSYTREDLARCDAQVARVWRRLAKLIAAYSALEEVKQEKDLPHSGLPHTLPGKEE